MKIGVYIPATHLAEVKQAMFDAGAGKVGNYDCCCWQVLGEGQFRPLDGSAPFIGSQGEVEKVSEYRVEMVCDDRVIAAVLVAMSNAHPYETPAYDVVRLENLTETGSES